MDDLKLEPYAGIQSWNMSDDTVQWEVILGDYLEKIAQHCTDIGNCVIGHIKALSIFSDQSYLRISVIAPDIPANIEGSVPEGSTELELTVNVLIYGLERTVIERIVRETAHEIAVRRKGTVNHKNIEYIDDHLHHTDRHDKSKGDML